MIKQRFDKLAERIDMLKSLLNEKIAEQQEVFLEMNPHLEECPANYVPLDLAFYFKDEIESGVMIGPTRYEEDWECKSNFGYAQRLIDVEDAITELQDAHEYYDEITHWYFYDGYKHTLYYSDDKAKEMAVDCTGGRIVVETMALVQCNSIEELKQQYK